jgi:NitT/TauT family transport system substrate-binding protein
MNRTRSPFDAARRLLYAALALVAGLAAALALPAACARDNGDGPTTIRVGYVPIADCLQLYAGVERGIFARHGLHVELRQLQSGQRIIEAMNARELDVGVANVVSTIVANARGVRLVSITGGATEIDEQPTRALIVRADSDVHTAADLAGKRVAINGLRNIEHLKLRQYLELHKVPVERVEVIEAPFPQMEGVLRLGSVAAAMAIEPYLTLALQRGSVRVLGRPYTETASRTFVSSYIATKGWVDTHTGIAKRFADAIAEATALVQRNPDEGRTILLKYTRVPEEVAQQIRLPHFEPYFQGSDLLPMAIELARQGIVPKLPDTNDIFVRF